MKLNYAQKELKAKEAEVKKMDEVYKKDRNTFEAVEKMKITLEKQIQELNYSGLYRLPLRNFEAICKGVWKCHELTLIPCQVFAKGVLSHHFLTRQRR